MNTVGPHNLSNSAVIGEDPEETSSTATPEEMAEALTILGVEL